ncbi:MAG: hypothetical protein ACLUI7_08755 [Coprococcus sp.]
MKIVKRFLFIISALLVLMLAGCSGKLSHIDINTTLTVDTTFNGSREMTADIPAAAYKYAFGGSLTALEDMINQYTPGDMYCTATENEDGGVRIQMIIDFASRNEYQKKIETICNGKQRFSHHPCSTLIISFYFKNGYTIEEFHPADFFYCGGCHQCKEYPLLKKHPGYFPAQQNKPFRRKNHGNAGLHQDFHHQSNAFDNVSVAARCR